MTPGKRNTWPSGSDGVRVDSLCGHLRPTPSGDYEFRRRGHDGDAALVMVVAEGSVGTATWPLENDGP